NLEKAAVSVRQIKCDRRAQWTCFSDTGFSSDGTMKFFAIIVLLALVVGEVRPAARAQDESEARSPSRAGLLKRGLKGKPTTTTTTQAPEEEVEYDDADYAAEEQQEPSTEAPPSSTEGKKLVAGGVRPFRSNTDLLETLKRRRAQAAEQSKHGHSSGAQESSAAETAAKGSYSKKRFNNPPPARESNNEEAPAAPASSAKPTRGRFGRPATRAIQETEAEEQYDAPAPTRTGRGFARRGGY
ncbi:unnamed protein product, partial [Chilo suppressalis]